MDNKNEDVLISLAEVTNIACIMNIKGMSYSEPSQVMSACGMSYANNTNWWDTIVPVPNRIEIMRSIAIEFKKGLVLAPASAQVYGTAGVLDDKVQKCLDYAKSLLSDIEEREENVSDLTWEEFIPDIADTKSQYAIFHDYINSFRGKDIIPPAEFLKVYIWHFTEKMYRLPDLYVSSDEIMVVAKVGVSFKPSNFREKLIYIYLFVRGVHILQSLPTMETSSYYNLEQSVALIDMTMRSYKVEGEE